MKDVKTLFIMGCLATLLNATFNLLFMRWIGVQGIALSSTVTQGLISIIFMRIIKKRLAIDTISEIFRNLVPVAVACVALIMAGYWLRMCFLGLDISPVLFLPAAGFILGISYLALLRFICLDELRTSVTLIVPRNLVNKILGPPRGW
jgi:putative peptidoglycan lipid II flippase